MRVFILRGVSSMLAAVERDASVLVLHVDFSSKNCSMRLNGFYLNSVVRRMLVGNKYRAADMVFTIIGAYTERAAGFQNDANMTGVYHIYSVMLSKVVSRNYGQS